jgi:D-alanyl-D-alanine carboxypeptidase
MTARTTQQLAITSATAGDWHWLADRGLRHRSAVAKPVVSAATGDQRATALARWIEDGCLLIASADNRALAFAALDLDRRAIGELAFAGSRPDAELYRRLLTEIERLAVRFGLDELTLAVPAQERRRFVALGYREHGARDSTTNITLRRSLNRRQTRYSRRVRAIGAELGIPADYARRHRIPMQAEASRLVAIGPDVFGRAQRLAPAAARAWREQVESAGRDGIVLQAVSAFRTVDYQRGLIRRKQAQGQSLSNILHVSAAPGYSEHHTGNAVDVTTPGAAVLQDDFERSDAFRWLAERAASHGFRLSFPRDNRHGLAYEPWHWCYCG